MKALMVNLALITFIFSAFSQKPKVWIYTDMSDKTIPGDNHEGTVNDPDDISAMAGYILMSSEFNTVGIVVASTHRGELRTSANQATWATNYFGSAYAKDLPGLNANIGGYPSGFSFQESCIKVSAEKYSNSKTYADLSGYSTVKSLLDYVDGQSDLVNVLIWGSTTEPAIFVKHCLSNGKKDLLKKVRFIAHWTNSSIWQGSDAEPWKVANCNEDINACNYLKDRAYAREIDYYECGAIGQNGVMGGVSGETYFNQFRAGEIGKIFREGKYAFNKVDHSDAATYWVLLGTYGVNLADINPNGTNPKATEQANSNKFGARSKDIHDELLRRAKAAVYIGPADDIPPTTPTNLMITNQSNYTISISWNASTDNMGVTGYDVFVNGTKKTSTNQTSTTISTLNCETQYAIKVRAYDAFNNYSDFTPEISATTLACLPCTATPTISGGNGSEAEQTAYIEMILPTTILAENVDNGANGAAYFDNGYGATVRTDRPVWSTEHGFRLDSDIEFDEEGGNAYIGGINSGEWAEYTVKVPVGGGTYKLSSVKYSTNSGVTGKVWFKIGSSISCLIDLPNTNRIMTTMPVDFQFALPEGEHVFLWVSEAFGFNLDEFEIENFVPSAINNHSIANNLKIHPNPAKSILNVETVSEKINIYDISGRIVNINIDKTTAGFKLNVEHLNAGIYFVKDENDVVKFFKE